LNDGDNDLCFYGCVPSGCFCDGRLASIFGIAGNWVKRPSASAKSRNVTFTREGRVEGREVGAVKTWWTMAWPFTVFEQERIFEYLRNVGRRRDALFIEMGCFFAFRISELFALRGSDVVMEVVTGRLLFRAEISKAERYAALHLSQPPRCSAR
jgi:hypothetical protein